MSKDPVLGVIQKLVLAAKVNAKQSIGKLSAFGPTSRHLARAKLKMTRKALWLRSQSQSEMQKAQHLKLTMSNSTQIMDSIKAARSMIRLEGAAKRRREASHWESIKQYSDTLGKADLQAVFRALPDLPLAMESIISVPDSLGTTISIPSLAADSVT
eukprot:3545194-Amphidinium_carterae.2